VVRDEVKRRICSEKACHYSVKLLLIRQLFKYYMYYMYNNFDSFAVVVNRSP
jgi:hypothetical protein